MVVMVTGAMAAAHSSGNQRWLFDFRGYFFFGIKLSMSGSIYSKVREAVPVALFMKNAERGDFAM